MSERKRSVGTPTIKHHLNLFIAFRIFSLTQLNSEFCTKLVSYTTVVNTSTYFLIA